jgi:hypothetical protein
LRTTDVSAKNINSDEISVKSLTADIAKVTERLTVNKLITKSLDAVDLSITGVFKTDSIKTTGTVSAESVQSLGDVSANILVADFLAHKSNRDNIRLPSDSDVADRMVIQQPYINDAIFSGGSIKGASLESTSSLSVDGLTSLESDVNIEGTLTVHGSVVGSGPYIDSSDERFKKDVKTLQDSLDKVCSIKGYTYNFNLEEFPERGFSNRTQIGWMAGELSEQLPELVYEDTDGYRHVSYAKSVPVLADAIRELRSELEDQADQHRNYQAMWITERDEQRAEMAELRKLILQKA